MAWDFVNMTAVCCYCCSSLRTLLSSSAHALWHLSGTFLTLTRATWYNVLSQHIGILGCVMEMGLKKDNVMIYIYICFYNLDSWMTMTLYGHLKPTSLTSLVGSLWHHCDTYSQTINLPSTSQTMLQYATKQSLINTKPLPWQPVSFGVCHGIMLHASQMHNEWQIDPKHVR